AHAGALELRVAGTADDAHALGDVDVDARLALDGPGPTWPLPEAAARARPFAAQGHVVHAGERWRATGVTASAGRGSTARGELELAWAPRKRWVPGNAPLPPQPDPPPPPRVQARVDEAVLDLADLRAWRDMPAAAAAPAAGLSTAPLSLARLRAVDGEVDLRALRLVPAAGAPAPAWLPTHASARATLVRGVLDVPRFALRLDGGHVEGSARVDASAPEPRLALDARVRGRALEALSPKLGRGGVDGRLDAHATLQARGDSERALAASASGNVDLALAPGASVPRKLDAKLSLDGGEWLRGLLDKSARVPVECVEVSLAVAHGGATTRRFAAATEHTALAGRGSVDLLDETFDLTLRPVRRESALLALDKAIHASGPWHAPRIRLESPPDDLRPQACAAAR
ncbi:MAG: AsmA family protein, partial [Burkholderiaceae bacterium]